MDARLPFDEPRAVPAAPPARPSLGVRPHGAAQVAHRRPARQRARRRRDLELQAGDVRPPLLHAQGRLRADPRGHVPRERPTAEVRAGRRPARRRARAHQRLRGPRRISDRLRRARAAGPRRAAARLRAAEEAAARRRALRRGAQAAAADAPAPHRRRDVARRRRAARHPARPDRPPSERARRHPAGARPGRRRRSGPRARAQGDLPRP